MYRASVQSQLWRASGRRVSTNELRWPGFVLPPVAPHVALPVRSAFTIYRALREEIARLEAAVLNETRLRPEFDVLKSIKGVGPVLALTIMLETGDIRRFPAVGDYSSYCRCVKSERLSNGKRKRRRQP